MKKYLIFIALILSSCCSFNKKSELHFSTNILPLATVGKEYNYHLQTINLILSRMDVNGFKQVSVNGLNVLVDISDVHVGNGNIYISGVPVESGEFYFHLQGALVGTQCPGRKVEKIFKIKVLDNKLKP